MGRLESLRGSGERYEGGRAAPCLGYRRGRGREQYREPARLLKEQPERHTGKGTGQVVSRKSLVLGVGHRIRILRSKDWRRMKSLPGSWGKAERCGGHNTA